MSDLLAARIQMAMSLAFHIVYAPIGIEVPSSILIGRRWRSTTGTRISSRGWAETGNESHIAVSMPQKERTGHGYPTPSESNRWR